jgi:tetratricopeptide (TPR) repeat protein
MRSPGGCPPPTRRVRCAGRSPTPAPLPEDLRPHDVTNVEQMTRLLRAMDYQFGGGACRDAVAAQAASARRLLTVDGADELRARLRLAVADLLNLAGWTSLDVGLHSSARQFFGLALEHAASCENPSLVANVLYRHGRLHLHQGYPEQALKFFQLGQLAARDAEEPSTTAMLHANEAWAHALMGSARKALNALGRAEDEFAQAGDGALPGWVSFFGAADLHALSGIVHGLLPSGEHTGIAIGHLSSSIAARGDQMTRSAVFELTALATIRLDADDTAAGVADGHLAVDLAEKVRSVRTVQRLAPLQAAARRHPADAESARLVLRIATLCGG